MNFDALTAEEINQLDGPKREAWYAHARGDDTKAREILAAYGLVAERKKRG